jgi:hypothetical protein
LTTDRPYANPEHAARKLLEIAKAVAPVQDGRVHIEKINEPFLYQERGTPAEYGAGLKLAIERGWLCMPTYKGPPYKAGAFVINRYTHNPYALASCSAAAIAPFRSGISRSCCKVACAHFADDTATHGVLWPL